MVFAGGHRPASSLRLGQNAKFVTSVEFHVIESKLVNVDIPFMDMLTYRRVAVREPTNQCVVTEDRVAQALSDTAAV
jgi:hypothetical protein